MGLGTNKVSRLNNMFMNLINNKLFFLYVFPMLIFFQGCGDHKDVIQHSQDNIIVKTDIPLEIIKSSLEIEPTPELTYEEFGTLKVINVVSGNRIEFLVNGELKGLTYLGVDIPNDAIIQDTALALNKFLVEGKKVTVEFAERISLSQEIGYVYVDGVFVNSVIIEKGLGMVSKYPEALSLASDLEIAQEVAQKKLVGIWGALISVDDKSIDSTKAGIPVFEGGTLPKLGNLEITQTCDFSNSPLKVIKGKFDATSSQRLFYTPDMEGYGAIDVVRSNGDKWFCTVDEALTQEWVSSYGK